MINGSYINELKVKRNFKTKINNIKEVCRFRNYFKKSFK